MPAVERFIVFEGVDGAGTTTQAHRLVTALCNSGTAAVFTCEPTDLPTGALIRSILHSDDPVQPETLALLFAADRREHVYHPHSGILATLREGTVVVCDRYLFSSLAYQGSMVDPALVRRLNSQFPLPSHLIFIDTSLDETQRRMQQRARLDRLEQDTVQQAAGARYRDVLEEFSGQLPIHHIDGNQDPDAVFAGITAALSADFPRLCR